MRKLKTSQPEDAIIVYFAGHGIVQQSRFYLIPHDLGYPGSRTNLNQAGLDAILAHGISDKELEQAFEKIDAAQFLMVIDTCNSGQALESVEQRRGPMNSKGLAQLAYEKGMYILAASQSYEQALGVALLVHGLLEYVLIEEALKNGNAAGNSKDGQVNLRQWLEYAADRVPQIQIEKMGVIRERAQRPRIFYRREPEVISLIVVKSGAK